MLSVVMLTVVYADYHKLALYADFHYAECRYAERRSNSLVLRRNRLVGIVRWLNNPLIILRLRVCNTPLTPGDEKQRENTK
jgi:hypothetical protein